MADAPDTPDFAAEGELVYRQRWPVRLWHWLNAFSIVVMLMSGLMIFNAHPRLYWGRYGANPDRPWLWIGATPTSGFLKLGPVTIPTTGVLGRAGGQTRAFPPLVTIPSSYNLADARQWHFFFAWLLVVPGIAFLIWGFVRRHVQRDLLPSRAELRPGHLWRDIKDHARLRFHGGEKARHYNTLQKLSYVGVIFVAIPLAVLTGLTMSPGINAAWPWLLDLFGGRQSARSLHFIAAIALAAFILVHLAMVVLAGPLNELRSMITGWYRLPHERGR
jgi:Ni/Fe-hydrogenase b-type cytochrome subunit